MNGATGIVTFHIFLFLLKSEHRPKIYPSNPRNPELPFNFLYSRDRRLNAHLILILYNFVCVF